MTPVRGGDEGRSFMDWEEILEAIMSIIGALIGLGLVGLIIAYLVLQIMVDIRLLAVI